MKNTTPLKLIGALWIILGPIEVLQALISTVKSDTDYYIQLGVFVLTGVLSVISGVGLLFLKQWALQTLRALSWLTFAYYAGSGALITGISLIKLPELSLSKTAVLLFVGLMVIATGIPFLLMALYLGNNRTKNAVRPYENTINTEQSVAGHPPQSVGRPEP